MGRMRVSRQELKRDEVKDLGEHIIEYVRQNQQMVIVLVAAVAVVWIALIVWGHLQNVKTQDSQLLLRSASGAYQSALMETDQKKRVNLFQTAAGLCQNLRNQFPGTSASRQAYLLQGNALFFAGSADAAINVYTDYLENSRDPDAKALALLQLGYCYEDRYFRTQTSDRDAYDNAYQHYYRAAEAAKSDYIRYQALLAQARLKELELKLDDAIEIYETIIKDAQARKDADKIKFGISEENAKASEWGLPSIEETFDAEAQADLQIKRLRALMNSQKEIEPAEESIPSAEEQQELSETNEEEKAEGQDASAPAAPEVSAEDRPSTPAAGLMSQPAAPPAAALPVSPSPPAPSPAAAP